MGRNGLGPGKTLSSPREPRSKLLFASKVSEAGVCFRDRGRVSNKLGHKSLKVNSTVEMGFQKAKAALSEMEILSQIAFLPFLSLLSLLLKEKYIRTLVLY